MYNLKNTKINFVSAEDGKVFLGYVENGVRKEKVLKILLFLLTL